MSSWEEEYTSEQVEGCKFPREVVVEAECKSPSQEECRYEQEEVAAEEECKYT